MILIIYDSDAAWKAPYEMLFRMGFLTKARESGGIPSETKEKISAVLRIPKEKCDAEQETKFLNDKYGNIPVFILTDDIFTCGENVFPFAACFADTVRKMQEYCQKYAHPPLGIYKAEELDLSLGKCASYLGREIALTKAEVTLLRYLTVCYPRRATAQDILSHAFLSERTPQSACVRAHISAINRKFINLFGHRAIGCETGVGYRIELS